MPNLIAMSDATPLDSFWSFTNAGILFIQIFVGIIAVILANIFLKRLLKYIRRRFLADKTDWKERLDQIFYFPFHLILWIIGVAYVIDIAGSKLEFSAGWSYIKLLRNGLVVACLGWVLMRWKREIQRSFLANAKLVRGAIEPGMIQIIGRLTSVSIIVITSMIILQIFGLDILPLVAFGGIGAAAVGFAGKDVIANFFGGLMLSITRPFTVGDVILIPERALEGTVEEVGWYLTTVRDKEKRPVYLPNALFSTIFVINSSRMSHRRIEETIAVRYDDFSKVKSLVANIRSMLSKHPAIDDHLPIIVYFNAFAESSLHIYIDVYSLITRLDEHLAVKQEILMKIQEIFAAEEAQMPFPTMTIYIPK